MSERHCSAGCFCVSVFLGCRNCDVIDVTLTHQVWSRRSAGAPPLLPRALTWTLHCASPGEDEGATRAVFPLTRPHAGRPGSCVRARWQACARGVARFLITLRPPTRPVFSVRPCCSPLNNSAPAGARVHFSFCVCVCVSVCLECVAGSPGRSAQWEISRSEQEQQ